MSTRAFGRSFDRQAPSGPGAAHEQQEPPPAIPAMEGPMEARAPREPTAIDLLCSLRRVSANKERARMTHEGLNPRALFVQATSPTNRLNLVEATPPAPLCTQAFEARLQAEGLGPVIAALFADNAIDEVKEMGEELPDGRLQAMRWATLVPAPTLAALLSEMRQWMTVMTTPPDDSSPEEHECVRHAVRVAMLVRGVAKAFKLEGMPSDQYLFALRGAEDLELLLESFAERGSDAEHAPDGDAIESLRSPWRTAVAVLEHANDICDGLHPRTPEAERPSPEEVAQAVAQVASHIRFHWETAVAPFPGAVPFDTEEEFEQDLQAFVGRRRIKTMAGLRDTEQERQRIRQQHKEVGAPPGAGSRPRTPVAGGEAVGSDASPEWGLLAKSDATKLRNAIANGTFKRWDKPEELAVIHHLRFSPLAKMAPESRVRPANLSNRNADLWSTIWDRATCLVGWLCPPDSGFQIPIGTMVKMLAGLLSSDRHSFSFRRLAFPTHLKRGSRPDPESAELTAVYFTSSNMTWFGIDSGLYMLDKIVRRGILPRVLLSQEDVGCLQRAVLKLRMRWGADIALEDVAAMVEEAITRHVNAVTDMAAEIMRHRNGEMSDRLAASETGESPGQHTQGQVLVPDADGVWPWPKLEDCIQDWERTFAQTFRDAAADSQTRLRKLVAQQADNPNAPPPQHEGWVGNVKAAQERSRQSVSGRKRSADDAPAQGKKPKREKKREKGAGRPGATTRTGVVCHACFGENHTAGSVLCHVKKGSGIPFVTTVPDGIDSDVLTRILKWRSSKGIQEEWARAPATRGATAGQGAPRSGAQRPPNKA